MKIAFLTPEFPHPKTGVSGGIGTSILNLSKGLTLLGHRVSIVVYGQDTDESFEENGIHYYKIKNVTFKGLSLFLTQKKIEKVLNSLVKQDKIEIVEAPDWTGISSFISLNCPLVIKLHGSDTYFCHLDQRPVKMRNRFLEKCALKRADAIVSVSQFTGETTRKLFRLKSGFQTIHNGIDVSQFEPSTSDNNQNILYFGTLTRKKGVLELPLIFNEVIQSNPKAQLILVGKDAWDIHTGNASTWNLMLPLFDAKAIQNVTYLGSVPYADMKKQIQMASVCVFPTFAEALPVSWIEAMAMEKPIVASNIGWAAEIIDDGKDGFLVDPKNHSQFARQINAVLSQPELQSKMGTMSRKKVIQKFSNSVIAEQTVDFYQKILNRN
jgi:starch synthase